MALASDVSVTRSLVFVVCLLALLVGHQVGDHVLQTDHQAARKADRSWSALRAMAGHLFTYHLGAALVLVGTVRTLGLSVSVVGLLAGFGFSVASHGLLDRRWPVRALLRLIGSPRFAETTAPICGMHLADQALHKLALLISALLMATL